MFTNFVSHVKQTLFGGGTQKTRVMLVSTSNSKRRLLTAQAYRADVSDIDNIFMAKAGCSKVHICLGWKNQMLSCCWIWKVCHHQVLKKSIRGVQFHVDTAGCICCLLQKDRVSRNLANINRNMLIAFLSASPHSHPSPLLQSLLTCF